MDWKASSWLQPGAKEVARDHLLETGWQTEGHTETEGLVAVPTFLHGCGDRRHLDGHRIAAIEPRDKRMRTSWDKLPTIMHSDWRCVVVPLRHYKLKPDTVWKRYSHTRPRLSHSRLWAETQEVQERATQRKLGSSEVEQFCEAVRKAHRVAKRYNLNPWQIEAWCHGGAVANSYRYAPDATWLRWCSYNGAYAMRSYARKASHGVAPYLSASVRISKAEGALRVAFAQRHAGRAWVVRQ